MSNEDILISISERTARMEERMELWAPAGAGESCKEHREHMASLDARLSAIEKGWWTLSGKMAGLMIGASFFGGFLVKWILG